MVPDVVFLFVEDWTTFEVVSFMWTAGYLVDPLVYIFPTKQSRTNAVTFLRNIWTSSFGGFLRFMSSSRGRMKEAGHVSDDKRNLLSTALSNTIFRTSLRGICDTYRLRSKTVLTVSSTSSRSHNWKEKGLEQYRSDKLMRSVTFSSPPTISQEELRITGSPRFSRSCPSLVDIV